MKSAISIIFCFCLFISFSDIKAQIRGDNIQIPFFNKFEDQFDHSFNIPKPQGHLSCEQWRQRIDLYWGAGLSTVTKLQVFDSFWNKVDSSFAAFHNINDNWDSLKLVYRTEIQAGVSRGRFIAIMNYLTLHLRESHTKIIDYGINTTLIPGKPLFALGGWNDNGHFGAGLTPMPDSSLLVYSVVPLHPLGLQKGDIVLGYDRIPWRILVRELINCQLPIKYFPGWIGSSPSAFNHSLLISAGMNWHLFDTIDVVKYSTGDTLHLPTSLLINQNLNIFCTEQMDIPGVPKPIYDQQLCSYGIIPSSNIGYIYVWGWWGNVSGLFYNAVQSLMNTDGIIIDFRYNEGGNMFLSNPGLSLLFDTLTATIDFGYRCSPSNHQQMCPENNSVVYIIPGEHPGYQKPIAVLTGPGAISSGDQVALRMKYHPKSRFFGKSTAAAFNAPYWYYLSNNYWLLLAEYDAFKLSNPSVYLTHEEFEVDENVWLSRELVAQGRDDVVEAAMRWIDSVTIGITHRSTEVPNEFKLFQNYPNPFNPNTKIKFSIPNRVRTQDQNVQLIIFDVLGREVVTILNEKLKPGIYETEWTADKQATGIYFYKLIAEKFVSTKKMILIK